MRFPWKLLARGRRLLNRGKMIKVGSFLWGSFGVSPSLLSPLPPQPFPGQLLDLFLYDVLGAPELCVSVLNR